MEQEKIWERRTPSLVLPPYLLVVFIMVTGFATVNLGMSALGGYTALLSNPFEAFSDIFPGQPRDAVVARGFSCPANFFFATDLGSRGETCILYPATGIFRQIQVIITNDSVQHISFILHDDSLKLGDIMTLWGRPEVHESGHAAIFSWPSSGVRAATYTYTGQFSFFLPVSYVSFIETN